MANDVTRRLRLLHHLRGGSVPGHAREQRRRSVTCNQRRDPEAMQMYVRIEWLASEVQVLQNADRPDPRPRILPVPLAAVTACPGALEELQRHVRHLQRQPPLYLRP